MKTLLALSLIIGTNAFTTTAFAEQQKTKDILKCSFTEPFYSLEFDANTGVVTSITPSAQDKNGTASEIIASSARLVSEDENKTGMIDSEYKIIDSEKGEILELELSLEGSDGMSELIYPFEVQHGQNVGGCSTETVKLIDTQKAVQRLLPTQSPKQ